MRERDRERRKGDNEYLSWEKVTLKTVKQKKEIEKANERGE